MLRRALIAGRATSADSYSVNYATLLHFDGADGSTTFTDVAGRSWTAAGNAQIDTSEFVFGDASLRLDGTGDSISTADSSDHNFGSGDFTLEGRFRFSSAAGEQGLFSKYSTGGGTSIRGYNIRYSAANGGFRTVLGNGTSSGESLNTPWTPAVGQWYHLAFVRSGSTYFIFVDGTKVEEYALSLTTIQDAAIGLAIGVSQTVTNSNFNGWVDEVRITKGAAVYTAGFAPPSSAYPDGRTVSLLHFDGAQDSTTFTDQYGRVWTPHGNAKIDTVDSVFGGASLRLDGSGDYLTAAASVDFQPSGDFTAECWFNASSYDSKDFLYLLSNRDVSGTSFDNSWSLGIKPSNGLSATTWVVGGGTRSIEGGGAIPVGTWHHVALCRDGNTARLFLDGSLVGSVDMTGTTYSAVAGDMFRIGAGHNGATSGRDFKGWIDEVRIIKGQALYTADFTPPSSPF